MSGLLRSFLKDARGVSALMFGLAMPAIALALGGGIDYSQASSRRQKIATAAELACQQASKDINDASRAANANPNQDYTAMATQIIAPKVNAAAQSGISGLGTTISIANNVITVNVTAASANAFGGVLGYDSIPVSLQRTCSFTLGSSGGGTGTVLFVESFESGHNVASNSWTVLKNWNGWTTPSGKGGIEINGIPSLAANEIRFGNFFAELDSHCYTSNCSTNSIMYRDIKAPVSGSYELRYWYISRVRNTAANYQVKPICVGRYPENNTNPEWTTSFGPWASNWYKVVDWANWEEATNKIEVYFDKASATIPASNKSNMVDVCVHATQWTERVIKLSNLVKDTTYRFYFRAAGREDTYGGLIDYIRFCSGTCP